MHAFLPLVQALIAVLSILDVASARPTHARELEQQVPTVPCWSLDTPLTETHLRTHMLLRPATATCLFYTRGLAEAAKLYAKNSGANMTTIWERWPARYYETSAASSNPLRCIMRNEADRTAYFTRMSIVFAESCTGLATVMDMDPHAVWLDGIFGTAELPALQKRFNFGGRVDQIRAINLNGTKWVQYWSRKSKENGWKLIRRETTTLQKWSVMLR